MKGFLRSRLLLTFVTLAMIAAALVIPLSGSLTRSHAASDRTVTVMTQNMDDGTDFGPIFTATSFSGFVAAVGATYNEVQAGNIPERTVAVAHEIGQAQPVLVGLQEVSQWLTGPLESPRRRQWSTINSNPSSLMWGRTRFWGLRENVCDLLPG